MSDWYLKLFILSVTLFFVGIIVFTDWARKKQLIVYLLIALFAQTGFSYAIAPGYHTSVSEILYFFLLVVMAARHFSNRERVPEIGIKTPVRFYIIAAIIGIFTAISFDVRLLNIFIEFKSYVGYVFYLYLVPFILKDKKDIRKCIWVFVIFSIIPVSYAISDLKELSLVNYQRLDFGEGWGEKNVFIGYILPIIFFALILLQTEKGILKKSFFAGFLAICIYALFYSGTRTGWISFLVALIVYTYLTKTKIIAIIMLFLITIGLTLFGMMETIENITQKRLIEETIEQPSTSLLKRFDRWETATITFKAHPITGSGWGGYLYPLSKNEVSNKSLSVLPRWHNSFFEILSQVGLLGIVGFYWIWFNLGKLSLQALKSTGSSKSNDRIILAGLVSAVTSIFIYSLGEQQFYKIETASISWFIVGLMIAFAKVINMQSRVILPSSKGVDPKI